MDFALIIIGSVVAFFVLRGILNKIVYAVKSKRNTTPKAKYSANTSTVSVTNKFSVHRCDYSRYFQAWDENYDKNLGYEWFRICVEIVNFPIYNSIDIRLVNIRKSLGITQVIAAQCGNISLSTLSSYENGRSMPSSHSLDSLSNVYNVPIEFIKYGYVNDLEYHINLCQRFGEEEYVHNLSLAVKSASKLFPEMLTPEDKEIVIFINNTLKLNLDLFNEKTLAKERLQNKIELEIMQKLNSGEVNQRDLYSSYGEERYIAQKVVKKLFGNGIIIKEKYKDTFLLKLSETKLNNNENNSSNT